jgi:hypothetical protein
VDYVRYLFNLRLKSDQKVSRSILIEKLKFNCIIYYIYKLLIFIIAQSANIFHWASLSFKYTWTFIEFE